jgi:hypothetical protein
VCYWSCPPPEPHYLPPGPHYWLLSPHYWLPCDGVVLLSLHYSLLSPHYWGRRYIPLYYTEQVWFFTISLYYCCSLLYMCPHTTATVCYIFVLILLLQSAIYVSSYYQICAEQVWFQRRLPWRAQDQGGSKAVVKQ